MLSYVANEKDNKANIKPCLNLQIEEKTKRFAAEKQCVVEAFLRRKYKANRGENIKRIEAEK